MLCPQCDTELPPENRFCEECGTALPAAEIVAEEVNSDSTGVVVDGCPKCGAPGESVDAEGYCSECGFRRGKPSRNHFENVVSARFAGVCDRGLRHSRNEDFFCISRAESGMSVLVVCDGVSSSRRAEEASQSAAESACKVLMDAVSESMNGFVREALREAQAAVLEIDIAGAGVLDAPPTTLVAAVVDGNRATIAWVGDSRAYWISPNGNRQLTRDHSWVNEFAGVSGAKPNSAQMHAITRWLGSGAPEDDPAILEFEIPGPGTLLLCTDGLWNYAPETDSLAALVASETGDAVDVARALVNFARAQGGVDNITAALIHFAPEGENS